MNKYEQLIQLLKDFYKNNPPKTVEEYMSNYPRGYSRTSIKTNYNKKISDLLIDLNPEYELTNDSSKTKYKVLEKLSKLNLKLLSDKDLIINKDSIFEFKCNKCNHTHETYWGSLLNAKIGCRNCAGNLELTENELNSRLLNIGKDNNLVFSKVPKLNRDEMRQYTINCRCLTCNTYFNRELSGTIYHNSAICANCFPSKAYSITKYGITFSSKFELACYEKLLTYFSEEDLFLHIKYSKISDTTKRYTADFYIPKYNAIIEVTSYNINSEFDKFKKHSNTLEIKKNLAEKSNIKFFVVRSLSELDEVCNTFLKI